MCSSDLCYRLGVRRAIAILLASLLTLAVLAGCAGGSGGGGTPSAAPAAFLVRYDRVWADGLTEQTVIAEDGKVLMRHGEHLERLVLDAADVERIRAAMAADVPAGDPGGSPDRTVTYGDGTVIAHATPDAGSVTELLERFMDTHSLG